MSPRPGWTRGDAVVLLAMMFLAAGLALPAIAGGRRQAELAGCQANLKKLAQGMLAYEALNGRLTPRGTTTPAHGWITYLLPHVGEEKLAKAIRRDVSYFDPTNQAAVTTQLSFVQCPATPHQNRVVSGKTGDVEWKAAAGDYACNGGIFPAVMEMGILPADTDRWTVFANDSVRPPLKLADVRDGLAGTMMLAEMAGRNEAWFAGIQDKDHPQDPMRGPWAAGTGNHFEVRGHSTDGRTYPGPCSVNCSNFSGLYGFHEDVANIAMLDGSTRSLRKGMNIMVLYALCTPSGGEVLVQSDLR